MGERRSGAASNRLSHPAWIEVDLDALADNARVLRRAIPADTKLGLLVKANGYGHGLEMAARAAVDGGADQLIVATLDEGLALRSAGFDAPVLVVYPVPPAGVADAVQADLELSVGGLDSARSTLDAWTAARKQLVGSTLRLHVEVDTGMGRGGAAPGSLADVVGTIDAAPATELAGVWSHLASGGDGARSAEQIGRFESAVHALAARGRPIPLRHVAATDGFFAATAPAYEMVRIGIGYYGELAHGLQPAARYAGFASELRRAMAVKARAVRLEDMPAGATVGYGSEWTAARDSRVATLPIGYADGWTRSYWPGATALVRGRRVQLIGRVSMDSVCADVTDVPGVTADDDFVLLGRQGAEMITAADLARLRGSIAHEVFCDFGGRLRRVYVRGGRASQSSDRRASPA